VKRERDQAWTTDQYSQTYKELTRGNQLQLGTAEVLWGKNGRTKRKPYVVGGENVINRVG